ncbi:TPA: hypothetical protein ACNDN2_003975, partial [Escherichia coli]
SQVSLCDLSIVGDKNGNTKDIKHNKNVYKYNFCVWWLRFWKSISAYEKTSAYGENNEKLLMKSHTG